MSAVSSLITKLHEIKTKSGKFVFDIETTGKCFGDHLIAVGWIYNLKDGTTVKGYIVHNPLTDEEKRLLKEGLLDWLDLWMRKGWEMRCFHEFWHNTGPRARDLLPTLKHLLGFDSVEAVQGGSSSSSSHAVVDTEFEFIARFNRVLKEAEEHWGGKLQIVNNTTAYDTCWMHHLLLKHRFQPLDATRFGKHTWSYDSDSALIGAMGITPHTTQWSKFDAFLTTIINRLPGDNVQHDHNPENDAHHIFARWERFELLQSMVSTNLLDVLTAGDEEFEEVFARHLEQYIQRIHFLRTK